MENWSQVNGFPNYEVSDRGQIANLNTGRILRLSVTGSGLLKVNLYNNGRLTQHMVNRLVAEAFLGDYEEGRGVKHRNGDVTDNRVENLYMDKYVRGRANDQVKIKVVETGEIFNNMSEVARAINGQKSNVRRVLEGTLHTHKGHTFQYIKV